MRKDGLLGFYGVGRDYFDPVGFAEECEMLASGDMGFRENALLFAFRKETTTEEERRFIESMLRVTVTRSEPEARFSDMPTMSYVMPRDILAFGGTKKSYHLDFSPARQSIGEMFAGYLDGSIKKTGKKIKKTDLARFGHLGHSASQNFAKALNPDSDREGTFEFMSICCLYFQLEAIYATVLFHRCRGVEELQSYPYIGAALWLFLEDECYDYELFVKTCCQALKSIGEGLPKAVSKCRYWNEVYEQVDIGGYL